MEASRKAAMLLYEYARGIQVPVMVSGHHTSSGSVIYSVFTDFDSPNQKKDGYRIAKMEAGGSNRDGFALAITADILSRRPEEYKVLYIISDGQPADYSQGRFYSGDPAKADIQSVIKKYEQKGVEFAACAIGSDKDLIENIYGEKRFVDIANLDLLPRTMAEMLKKRILK